ncbi:hypothetical protein ES703_13521 [subsurface metagenome]
MSKIVTGDQRLVTGATRPKAVYSRRVSCWVTCPGGGARHYGFTQPVGQDCWLLGVDLWGQICLPTITPHWFVALRTSLSHPQSITEARACDFIQALNIWGSGGYWTSRCSDYHWHWDMCVAYTGGTRLFGIDVINMSADIGDFMASFHVTEG